MRMTSQKTIRMLMKGLLLRLCTREGLPAPNNHKSSIFLVLKGAKWNDKD